MCTTCNTINDTAAAIEQAVALDGTFDKAKADAFSGKMIQALNGGAIALMSSIGHRCGLFDALGDGEWVTSRRLAEKAELSERYVREWLGAMLTGGIVEYRREDASFRLPKEHAAFLTRAATPNNFAASLQWVGVLGAVETTVLEAFRHGRGVPYSAYDRFHEVMAEESNQTTVSGLDEHILPVVPGMVDRMIAGCAAVDVGCGRGRALMHMAERFPRSRFTGLDFSAEATAAATDEARRRGLTNVTFLPVDAAKWDEVEAYDYVFTFDAVHDQARPDVVLANIRRALRPGGAYLMQDIRATSDVADDCANPLAPFTYTISCMHCMSVSLASGGMGLGAAWGRRVAKRMLAEAGFTSVQVHELPHDIINDYYVCRA